MAINFPNSPNLYDVYTDSVSKNSYVWTGDYWTGFTSTTSYQVSFNIASIVVEDDSSPVGVVSTLDFADNLGVTFSAGVATVTGAGGIATGFSTTASINTTGVITAFSFSGSGASLTGLTGASSGIYGDSSYVPQITVDSTGKIVGISTIAISGGGGGSSFETLSVSGVSTFNGAANFGSQCSISTTGNDLNITANNTITISGQGYGSGGTKITSQPGANLVFVDAVGGDVSLYYQTGPGALGSEKRLQTLGTGVTVTGTTFTNQLSVSDVSTVGTVGASSTTLVVNGYAKIDGIDINGKSSTNTHIGKEAGKPLTGGQQNVALGMYALLNNTNSNFNTAIGMQALGALGSITSGAFDRNTALGSYCGAQLTTGFSNTFLGASAGSLITTGSNNTIVGRYDGNSNGLDIRTSSNNIVLSDGDGNIRFYANSSGDVGIGTTNPTSALTVKGNTSLETLSVSGVSTFSDDIDFKHDGNTRAYWDGSAGSFELKDGSSIAFGDSDDVLAFWDGTDFYLSKQTVSGSIKFTKSTGNETIAVFSNDGPVELYYDNSKKLETASSGINVVGTTTTGQLSVTGVSTFQNDININGDIYQNGVPLSSPGALIGLGTFIAAVGIGPTIDSFVIATTDYKTVEYTLHVGFGSYIHAQKALIMQNGSNAYCQEYAIMGEPDILVSVNASVSSGVCSIYVVPEVGVTGLVTYRYNRTALL